MNGSMVPAPGRPPSGYDVGMAGGRQVERADPGPAWAPGLRRRAVLPTLALASSHALAGCQFLPWTVEHYLPAPAVVRDRVDSVASARFAVSPPNATGSPAPEGGSVPEGFAPAAAVLCSTAGGLVDGPGGKGRAVVEERLSGDLAPLLAALAEPSDRARPDQSCTADLEIVPTLWLVDARRRAIIAEWPTTGCGKTKPGVHQALAGMATVQSTTHRVDLVEPDPWQTPRSTTAAP
ncbi:hypothetical protein ACQCSX_20555 [Pseudarthrobacter sp. P1]|uniref:hypothetical protein n=1 Tax=Pseudarthrobacter sp. P1 TaxID=3418418 RepID=UPI003CF36E6E